MDDNFFFFFNSSLLFPFICHMPGPAAMVLLTLKL